MGGQDGRSDLATAPEQRTSITRLRNQVPLPGDDFPNDPRDQAYGNTPGFVLAVASALQFIARSTPKDPRQ